MILIIDNYDSFTYNLYQYLGEICPEIEVYRNDAITPQDVLDMGADHLVLSPGPGHPADAGVCVQMIQKLSGRIPILGICLGHQAIGLAFGGTIGYAPAILHGKTSRVYHTGERVMAGLDPAFEAGRYHSLLVERDGLPEELTVLAQTGDGLIMALAHREHPTYGLQFHPESILTGCGKTILKNFLKGGQSDERDVAEIDGRK
jgi:anthranilate synthase/aminodeoxychorismate synthase-like glutamine amidotransferase